MAKEYLNKESSKYIKWDFLLVGFPKCGTTTLDAILRGHSQINLPTIKETQLYYLEEKYSKDLHKNIKRYYINNDCNRKIGAIEPSFYRYADQIAKDIESDTKIIFMIRNPIQALYSYFRMNLRYVENKESIKYVTNYNTSLAKKFDSYIKSMACNVSYKSAFNYYYWICTFMKYIPKENIKVVLFEDFCIEPEIVVKDILEFIGVEYEKLKLDFHENEGSKISKNILATYVNYKARNILTYLRQFPQLYKIYEKTIYKKIQSFTLIDSDEEMLYSTYIFLIKYFQNDVSQLSKFVGRDLFLEWNMIK